ncbi:MAG: tetratricopeptide repeat protein [Candidatus Edwardsbacteria bacterium]|nr:tetratricopeptide repeat protein [Candidatus Edwardsbacteria bacterium]
MTFVDLIIERHSCDQALKRAVAHFNGHRYQKAISIFEALYHPELKECIQFSEVVQFYLIESYMALGKQSLHRRKLTDAVREYRMAVKLAPHYADLHFIIGKIHLEQKKQAAAHIEFLRALKINPLYQEARVQLGLLRFKQRKHESALGLFRELSEDCSLFNQEHFDRAMTAAGRKQFDLAARYFAEAFRVKPDQSHALCAMGQDAYRERRYDKAIAHFIRAQKLAPNYADVYNHLGVCYSQKGQWNKAVENFELAVKLSPRFTRAWLNLAYTCERKGDPTRRRRAAWAARNVMRLDPKNKLAAAILRRSPVEPVKPAEPAALSQRMT